MYEGLPITFGREMGQGFIKDGRETVSGTKYAGLLVCFRESN